MTRRSKSNKCGAFFTYHERHSIRHGTERRRLPGGSMKPWHHCAISLTTPTDPVLTPHGILYDREAILKTLLRQKAAMRLEREAQLKREQTMRKHELHAEQMQRVAEERRHERARHHGSIMTAPHPDEAKGEGGAQRGTQQNFWMPGADAASKATCTGPSPGRALDPLAIEGPVMKRKRADKVSSKTTCPVTNQPLRLRDLISLKLATDATQASPPSAARGRKHEAHDRDDAAGDNGDVDDEGDADDDASDESLHDMVARREASVADVAAGSASAVHAFVCPVCDTALSNATKPVALRTGTVLCLRCVDEFVRPDARDPCTSEALHVQRDIIAIDNSGTGFAGSAPTDPGSKEASLYRPSVT